MMIVRIALLLLFSLYSTPTLADYKLDEIVCLRDTSHSGRYPVRESACLQALGSMGLRPNLFSSADFELTLPKSLGIENCNVQVDVPGKSGFWLIDATSAARMFQHTLRRAQDIMDVCQVSAMGAGGAVVTSIWVTNRHEYFTYRITVYRGMRPG